jgi:hypothetical protein
LRFKLASFIGKGKAVEEVRETPSKAPASKTVDAEIAKLKVRVVDVEREFEALEGDWQGELLPLF